MRNFPATISIEFASIYVSQRNWATQKAHWLNQCERKMESFASFFSFFAIQHHFIYALNPQLIEWFFSEPKIYRIFVFFFLHVVANVRIYDNRTCKTNETDRKKNEEKAELMPIVNLWTSRASSQIANFRLHVDSNAPREQEMSKKKKWNWWHACPSSSVSEF